MYFKEKMSNASLMTAAVVSSFVEIMHNMYTVQRLF